MDSDSFAPEARLQATKLIALSLTVGALVFALSVSVSLALCRTVMAAPERFSTLAFFILVVAHLVLWVAWHPIIQLTMALSVDLVATTRSLSDTASEWSKLFAEMTQQDWRALFSFRFGPRGECGLPSTLGVLTSGMCAVSMLGLVGNGLRLYFSALFLLSFVSYRIIGNVGGKLWANFIESEWPIFTTLFVSFGVLWAATATIVGLMSKA